MSIRYPTLDEFWPAVRARHFVKALGGKPTKYVENMAFLAARAGVHVKQMYLVNPIIFAERNCIPSVRKLLGDRTYVTLDLVRNSKWHPSAKWFYALNEPIPPYMDWDGLTAEAKVMTEEAKANAKVWGTLPYINDEDFAAFLKGEEMTHATQRAFGDMDFVIRCSGLATYIAVRKACATKGYYQEELYGDGHANIPRAIPIDLHSEEGLAAFAAGKPLPHPLYTQKKEAAAKLAEAEAAAAAKLAQAEATAAAKLAEAEATVAAKLAEAVKLVEAAKVKRSWWSGPWLCV